MDGNNNDKQDKAVQGNEGKEAPKVEAQAAAGTEAGPPAIQAAAATGRRPTRASPSIPSPTCGPRPRPSRSGSRPCGRSAGTSTPRSPPRPSREGWDVTRTELEVLRADRPKAPAAHVPDNTMTGTVLEAACMLTGGIADDAEKLYDEKTLDAAEQAVPGRHRPPGAAAGGGLGQRLRRPQLPRQPRGAAVRLRPRRPGGPVHRGHRRHPVQRRQQVPAGRLLLASSGPGGTSARSATSATSRPSRATA